MSQFSRTAAVVTGVIVMWTDVVASGVLAGVNRWRVLHDHPPAIVPGYGARIAAYVGFVLVAGLLLRYVRRHIDSRKVYFGVVFCFGLLICRALLLGPFYPWGARDLAELVAAKAAVDSVSREGQRYFARHGRVAESLEQLNLSAEAAKIRGGFTLGYERAPDGFRVSVRGAPSYIAHRNEMRHHLSKGVVLLGSKPIPPHGNLPAQKPQ